MNQTLHNTTKTLYYILIETHERSLFLRKLEQHSKKLILFFYFVFALTISYRTAFPMGLETKFFGSVDLNASNNILIAGLGLSDTGNYMRVAVDVQDLTIS